MCINTAFLKNKRDTYNTCNLVTGPEVYGNALLKLHIGRRWESSAPSSLYVGYCSMKMSLLPQELGSGFRV